jgi:hypothetical protein
MKRWKEMKNYAGSKTLYTPSSIKEKEILARSAVSLPHQRKKKASGYLEGGWQPPAQARLRP